MADEQMVVKSLPNRRVLEIPKRLHLLWRQAVQRDWQSVETTWSVTEGLRTDKFDYGVFLVGRNYGHQWLSGITFDTRIGGLRPREEAAMLAELMTIDSFVKHYCAGAIDLDAICGMKPGFEGCSGTAWGRVRNLVSAGEIG